MRCIIIFFSLLQSYRKFGDTIELATDRKCNFGAPNLFDHEIDYRLDPNPGMILCGPMINFVMKKICRINIPKAIFIQTHIRCNTYLKWPNSEYHNKPQWPIVFNTFATILLTIVPGGPIQPYLVQKVHDLKVLPFIFPSIQ